MSEWQGDLTFAGLHEWKVQLKFLEDILGAVPLDDEIYSSYIATKREKIDKDPLPQNTIDEELASIVEEKGITGFHMQDNVPIFYDYVFKGFMKEACGAMRQVPKTESSKFTNYKKRITLLLFPTPRKVPIIVNGEMGMLERPLRAETAMGERIALAASKTIPAGSSLEFTITALTNTIKTLKHTIKVEDLLNEWFTYGRFNGLGQWRSGGWGRFEYTLTAKHTDA